MRRMWVPQAFFALFGLFICANCGPDSVSKLEKRLSDNPGATSYRWRAFSRVVALGNYLYVEGGELSQYVNGKIQDGLTSGLNSTLVIPIDKSWDSTTIGIKTIQKDGAPIVRNPSVLLDPSTGTVYSWGGETAAGGSPSYQKERQLWKLVPDGQGSGAWSVASAPKNTHRGEDASATTCNGMGYILGGFGTGATEEGVTGYEPHPGLATYDFRSGEWGNISAPAPLSPHIRGEADCVPFGAGGLVLFLGGAQTAQNNIDNPNMIAMDNITFYDTVTKKWHWQTATGATPNDIPGPRSLFCSAGAPGPNGTYDIFVYGGYDSLKTVLSDVYILSLPAFRWFHTSSTATPRWGHQCALAGKRQIVSVGGVASLDSWNGGPPQDPLPQGLGIFDLSTWGWGTHYNADAAAYDSSPDVEAWYQNGGIASMSWSSDEVKNLFVNGSYTINSTDPNSSDSPSTRNSPSPSSPTSSTPVGAIVGGVVAGVAALVVAGITTVWFRRRRARAAFPAELDAPARYYKPEISEMNACNPVTELPLSDSASPKHEMSAYQPPQELPSHNAQWYELPSETRYHGA